MRRLAYFHGYGGRNSDKPAVLERALAGRGLLTPRYTCMDSFFAAIEAVTEEVLAGRVDGVCGSSLGAFAALTVAKRVQSVKGSGYHLLTQLVNPCLRPFSFLMKQGHSGWAAACARAEDPDVRIRPIYAYVNEDDELLGRDVRRWLDAERVYQPVVYRVGGHRATNFESEIAVDVVRHYLMFSGAAEEPPSK